MKKLEAREMLLRIATVLALAVVWTLGMAGVVDSGWQKTAGGVLSVVGGTWLIMATAYTFGQNDMRRVAGRRFRITINKAEVAAILAARHAELLQAEEVRSAAYSAVLRLGGPGAEKRDQGYLAADEAFAKAVEAYKAAETLSRDKGGSTPPAVTAVITQ